MTHILFIAEFGSFGGTRSYFKNLFNSYLQEGHVIIVVLTKKQLDYEIFSLLRINDIKYYCIPYIDVYFSKLIPNSPLAFHIDFIIRSTFEIFCIIYIIMKESIQLVVISSGVSGQYLSMFVLPKRIIYIVHSIPQCKNSNKIIKMLLTLSLKGSKKIVTVSEYLKHEIIRCWLPKRGSPNISSIHISSPTVLNSNEYTKKESEKFVILTLGHVNEYKQPLLWINVAKKVIDNNSELNIEFVWAGDGDLFSFCKNAINQEYTRKIKFLGYRSNIIDLYEHASLYFQPSRIETFGLAVLDAMQFGIPSVVTDIGGLPEIVIHNVTGIIVEPGNCVQMVEVITLLIKNNELREKMGECSKLRYHSSFSFDSWKKKMLALTDISIST